MKIHKTSVPNSKSRYGDEVIEHLLTYEKIEKIRDKSCIIF